MKENITLEKSFDFAVRIVNLYSILQAIKKNIFSQNNYYEAEPV